jgi:hypothetical protein
VKVHDRVALGAGQVPKQDVTVLRATDTSGRVVYELRIQGGSRVLRFDSPAGGLAARPIDVSTGRAVPDDGVSKLDVEVETNGNRSVVVRVDGTVALALTGLAGGLAQQTQHVAVGIVGAAPTEQALTVAHEDLVVAIQPAGGGAPVVVAAGVLPAAPQIPAQDPTTTTAQSPPPPPVPPASLSVPQVSGAAVEGTRLVADPGTWRNADSIQIRWSRCAADGTGCRTIRGASGTSYTLAASDVGSALRAVVVAKNAGGTTTAASALDGPVASATPILITAPTVAGTAMQGETLTASPGTWTWATGPATYTWSRCDPAAGTCTPVAGASDATFVLGEDDIGSTIRVTASVPGARGPSSGSADSTVVVPAPPVSLSAPAISGSAIVGRTLIADPGNWSLPTPTLTYAWLRCAKDGSSCAPIDAATDAAYVATEDDAGSTIEVAVTGTNISGTATATSAATAPILGPAENLDRPTISGDTVAGATLTADPGTWDDPNATLSLAWQRCNTDGTCTAIDGATDSTYTLTDDDIGSTVGLTVTATNAAGTTTADADHTSTVVPPGHHHHRDGGSGSGGQSTPGDSAGDQTSDGAGDGDGDGQATDTTPDTTTGGATDGATDGTTAGTDTGATQG